MYCLLKLVSTLQQAIRCSRKRRIHYRSILAIIVECHSSTHHWIWSLDIWPGFRPTRPSMDNAHSRHFVYHRSCSGIHCICKSAIPRGKDDKQPWSGHGACIWADIHLRDHTHKDQRYRTGHLYSVTGMSQPMSYDLSNHKLTLPCFLRVSVTSLPHPFLSIESQSWTSLHTKWFSQRNGSGRCCLSSVPLSFLSHHTTSSEKTAQTPLLSPLPSYIEATPGFKSKPVSRPSKTPFRVNLTLNQARLRSVIASGAPIGDELASSYTLMGYHK